MTVSELLLQILKNEGVSHIFGVAGDALNPLVTAIAQQDRIKWIRMKHEGNASYAAYAQAALNDNLGVCASTVGPGALHLVNGLYNAKKERVPVLAITGQIPHDQRGTNFFQEVDLEKIFDNICTYQAIVRTPAEVLRITQRAIRIAVNQRCVCRIELPADVAAMDVEEDKVLVPVFRSVSQVIPPEAELKKASEMINNSGKVGILGGAGCRDAREEVLEFSRKIKAPITHTLRASDVFDHDAENVVGLTGLIGNPSGYKAVMDCDLLIMLGTDFPYTDFLPENTRTLQVDIRAENIGNRTSVDLGLQGDIKSIVPRISALCKKRKNSSFLDDLNQSFTDWKKDIAEKASVEKELNPMHPQVLASQLSEIASNDAIFVIDTGTSAIWSSNHMSFHSGRRILGSFNHGSMAVGLPAAIGAQLQYPEREVWALVGDGAFHMALNDFSTAADYELPINVIVFNNAELGFVKIEMEEAGLAPNFDALQVNNIDFAAFAELSGGEGIRISSAKEVPDAIKKARKSGKPFIIDAKVTKGELSLPPKVGLKQAKDFGVSKMKEVLKAIDGNKKQWENLKKEVEAFFSK